MENPFLFISPSENIPEVSKESLFKLKLPHLKDLDKEMLLSIIETLTSTNDALRKYIHLLEKRYE